MEKHLYLWGSGGTGQLGLGSKDDYTLPQKWNCSPVPLRFESVTTGGCHSAGICSDGQLFLWGRNDQGQLGWNTSEQGQNSVTAPMRPVPCIPHESKTKLVACGWHHTLTVISIGSDDNQEDQVVLSWGANANHQLGRNRSSDGDYKFQQITHLPLRLKVASIACGWKHSLLATADGDVFAWGSGRHGQLGLGSETLVAAIPQQLCALKGVPVSNVYCGWEHSVFRSARGEIFTCGSNRHRQLGLHENPAAVSTETLCERRNQAHASPKRVVDPRNSGESLRTTQVRCGWHFVACLTEDEKLVTWGKGSHGQLGLGQFTEANVPQVVAFSQLIQEIACGSEHLMVVTRSGDLYTCGWGEHGNLGHGENINRALLKKVFFFTSTNQKVISVAAGGAVSIAVTSVRSV